MSFGAVRPLDVAMSDAVAAHIAEGFHNNIRELEGLCSKLPHTLGSPASRSAARWPTKR